MVGGHRSLDGRPNSGVVVPTPNRLDLLPAPFFTSGTQRFTDIPFVLDASSDARTKQAAGIIASWFGLEANNESIRFQVAEGRFPPGNVVLVATQTSPLVAALGITGSGPSVSIRANPADSSSKVLAIVAESSGSLVAAARAFALQRYSREKDSAVLPAAALPQPRLPYDAPRWLDTSRDVKPAEKMSDSQLEVLGSGRVALYFRLPPDLYYGTRDTVPFHLRYRCTGLAAGKKAFAKLELNGQVIATRPIPAGEQITIREEIIYLPVASLYPRNTLAVEFDFEKTSSFEDSASRPRAAVLRSSELMVRGLPHFAAMPRLDMLANTGFPYTKFADLAQTLVVLPRAATADDVALYLTMIGFMSAQTGVSALRMEVTQDSEYALRTDKDLLLIGAAGGQPLLERWASSLIAQPYGKSFHVWKGLITESLLTRLPWADDLGQRQNLNLLLQNDLQLDALVQGFPSPEFPDRSVIAFTSLPGRTFAGLVEDWASVADASQLYGTISLFTGGSFHSFTFGQDRYELGHLEVKEAMIYWGRRYYWLSPILIFASIWILTLFCHRWLESRAAERLQTGLRSEPDAGFLALGRQ